MQAINRVSKKLQRGKDVFEYVFHCPGCGHAHGFRTRDWPMPTSLTDEDKEFFKNKWQWNGNREFPTLSPSVHVKRKIGERPDGKGIYVTQCHSFVKDGMIQFLSDCEHKLCGKTLEIPEF